MLLPDVMLLPEAERILEHVLTLLAKLLSAAPGQAPPGASIGVLLAPDDGAEPDVLIRNARHAMFSAKRSGGNCFHLFDADQERRSRASREVLGNLRQALARGELELHYQPQVNLRSGSIAGAEALLRWRDPQHGIVALDEFLPHTEDSDFMVLLGDWVLETALQPTCHERSPTNARDRGFRRAALPLRPLALRRRTGTLRASAGVPEYG